MQITVIASDLAERTWTIPKSLLAHHAGYFRRTDRFKEGEQNKVTFESFEPEIFELFVEFMYFGRYSYCDDLQDATRIRDSAKAWVMGDYLDAVGFKNFALKNLHGIYFPPDNQAPRSTVGPELIDYCCAMSPVNSSLYNLISDVLIVFWDDCNVVIYNDTNNKQWDEIWDEHRKFRNSILYYTNQTKSGRAMRRLPVKDYL
jgi:hypothetical protein